MRFFFRGVQFCVPQVLYLEQLRNLIFLRGTNTQNNRCKPSSFFHRFFLKTPDLEEMDYVLFFQPNLLHNQLFPQVQKYPSSEELDTDDTCASKIQIRGHSSL